MKKSTIRIVAGITAFMMVAALIIPLLM